MATDRPASIRFRYDFNLGNERSWSFDVELDPIHLTLIPPRRERSLPEWTRLEVGQCENCPLSRKEHEHCPVAVAIIDVVDRFATSYAHEKATVTVHARERRYEKDCSLQIGLGSLMGLLMATSGCPVMAPLKPIARSHLPFATSYETIPRIASRYLFQQYLHWQNADEEPDWELRKLSKIYAQIQLVNNGISKRLETVKVRDASRNAVSHLHIFAELLAFSIDENMLKEVLDDLRNEDVGG